MIGPLIYIKNSLDKGLRIHWNFSGLKSQSTCQTYHLLLMSQPSKTEYEKIFRMYYQKLQLGHILGVVACSRRDASKIKIIWIQKTGYKLQPNFLENINLYNQFKGQNLQEVVKEVKRINGWIIVNIVVQKAQKNGQNPSNTLTNKITQLRKHKSYTDQITFNLIQNTQNQTRIDSTLGINYLYYDNSNRYRYLDQIFQILSYTVVKKITIKIQSDQHTYFKLTNDNNWEINQSSVLEKCYYSVPTCTFKEYLIFIMENDGKESYLKLDVNLRIQFYNGKEIHSSKNIEMMTNSGFHKSKTALINFQRNFDITEISKNYTPLSNLTQSKNYIWVGHYAC